MFSPYSDTFQDTLDHFYSEKKATKKYEAMDNPYNQIPEQKLFIDYLSIELKEFQEQWYQRSKQQEEELKQLRETYHDKQHKIFIEKQQKLFIDSLANELKMFQEQCYKGSKKEK